MVIDSSALIAILLGESPSVRLATAVLRSDRRLISTASVVECAAVMLAKKGTAGELTLDSLLRELDVTVVPVSIDVARAARAGYRRFGKGVGSPGVLNFGDCFAYGLAIAESDDLLFVGEDFAKTDVRVAVY